MKKLMMTTALVAATSFGAMAQTAHDGTAQNRTASVTVPAFLSSQFTGMTLYTLDSDAARALHSTARQQPAHETGMVGHDARMSRWTSSETFGAQRDQWESVGSINDIVMTQDGEIRGIIVDVGGFLGFMAHTVMIDIEDLYFVVDQAAPVDVNDFFVVATYSRDQLEALPEWSDDNLRAGFEMRQSTYAPDTMTRTGDAAMPSGSSVPPAATLDPDPSTAAREGRIGTANAPAPAPEGYVVVDANVPTAEQLLGAGVYDAMGDSVGDVDDLTLSAEADVAEVIVDIGGFLGLGTHTVALPLENVDVLWNQSDDSVRIHLPMSRDQLETLPEYQG